MKFHALAFSLWSAASPVESWSAAPASFASRRLLDLKRPALLSSFDNNGGYNSDDYNDNVNENYNFNENYDNNYGDAYNDSNDNIPDNNANIASKIPYMGLNELQTQFRRAVATEDFDACILYQNEIADRLSAGAYRGNTSDEYEAIRKKQRLNWGGLGTAPWLIDRLKALDFPLPTTIQINSFEAVNAILNPRGEGLDVEDTLEERMEMQRPQNMGIVISGSTGSGKTLSYLVPTLSTLSQTLFTRERIRIKAEEDVADVMGDLLDRVIMQTSPQVRGQGYQRDGVGQPIGAQLSSSLGKSGTDVKSPVCLIVVPTRELGVQISLLLFQLVGGTVKKSATERLTRKKNPLYNYKGPKGVKIGCVLDDKMSEEGLKLQTDIAITTPKYLTKLIHDKDIDPSKLRVVIYDEADLGLEQTSPDDLRLLFDNSDEREFSRISYLVGATVTESLGTLAVKEEILPEGKSFIATATRFAPLTKADETANDGTTVPMQNALVGSVENMATLKDLGLCLDPGLNHERLIAPDNTGMLSLTRMLRQELRDYEADKAALESQMAQRREPTTTAEKLREVRKETADIVDASSSVFDMSNADSIGGLQRPKVVVFFPDEESAREAISPLRDAVWGEHKLCVLLPNTGVAPIQIMNDFRDGKTSVMIATPNSVRGLDFPELTHVYTLYLPANDPREYVHLAGRVGRIGQQGSVAGKGGRVTTILDPADAQKMESMAEFLGFNLIDVDPVKVEFNEESNVEDMRRFLEDSFTLLGTAESRDIDFSQVRSDYSDDDYGNEEDDGTDYYED